MKKYLFLSFILLLAFACNPSADQGEMKPPVIAPFEGIDTLAINDWWNRGPNPIIEMKVNREEVIAFGIYTVSNKVLKLSAQLFPLYPDETPNVRLSIKTGDEAIIFGKNKPVEILAKACQTISYEVLSRISGRVKRLYIHG